MKEYQVVSVCETTAWRNGEIYCTRPEKSLGEVMEFILNTYAADDWDVKKILQWNNSKVLIIFERSCEEPKED